MLAAPVQAYQPNYKFKIDEKEQEFDEYIRPIIKDKDIEAKVRDLYTKAHGIDFVKSRLNEQKEEYKRLKSEYSPLKQSFESLNDFLNRGDFKGFIDAAKIPPDMVYKYVAEQLRYKEMDRDAREEYDKNQELARKSLYQERNLEQVYQENQQIRVQQRNFELDFALQKPEVGEIAKAYDEMARSNGIPTFRDECINQGYLHAQLTKGEDLPVPSVIGAVMKKISPFVQMMKTSTTQGVNPSPANRVVQKNTAAIPHVGGGSTSPIDKPIRSLKDLEMIANQKLGAR